MEFGSYTLHAGFSIFTSEFNIKGIVDAWRSACSGDIKFSTFDVSNLTNPPTPRYVVIDLGTNMTPVAQSQTGYVLLWNNSAVDDSSTNYYRWYNGTREPSPCREATWDTPASARLVWLLAWVIAVGNRHCSGEGRWFSICHRFHYNPLQILCVFMRNPA